MGQLSMYEKCHIHNSAFGDKFPRGGVRESFATIQFTWLIRTNWFNIQVKNVIDSAIDVETNLTSQYFRFQFAISALDHAENCRNLTKLGLSIVMIFKRLCNCFSRASHAGHLNNDCHMVQVVFMQLKMTYEQIYLQFFMDFTGKHCKSATMSTFCTIGVINCSTSVVKIFGKKTRTMSYVTI